MIDHEPISKARPRFCIRTGKAYSTQKKEQQLFKNIVAKQMKQKGMTTMLDGPIYLQADFYTPIPKSISKKKYLAMIGQPDMRRKDIDNYLKMILDSMNNILYIDDAIVTHTDCRKIYSDRPRIEFKISTITGERMINEHAKTVKDQITVDDLNYMVNKANKLGLSGRQVIRVFMQEDNEGKHYYFECEGLSVE